MIVCPACGSVHLRAHASIQRIVWGRRSRFWGPVVPKGTTVGIEVSCGDCLHAFTSYPDGSFKQAPMQQAWELLSAARSKVMVAGKGPNDGKDAEARPSRPQARPAPDPRSRKR